MSSKCACIEEDPTDVVIDERETVVVDEVEITDVVDVAEQGPPGPPGPAGGETTVTVGADPISGHSAVAIDAGGLLVPADATNSAHRGAVLGITENAYTPGQQAAVKTGFVLEHSGWTWAPGPILVGVDGGLAQSLPVGATFSQTIAHAVSATRVLVDILPPVAIT